MPPKLDAGLCSYCGQVKPSMVFTSQQERLCQPCADIVVTMTMRDFIGSLTSFHRKVIQAHELRMNLAKYHILPCPHCSFRHRGGPEYCGTATRAAARKAAKSGAA